MADAARRKSPERKAKLGYGSATPRLAPPTPARSDLPDFRAVAESMGITLMPWQETAGRYLTAKGRDGRLLYREVCILVARQNGKTTLAKPLIVRALRSGKRVMHIAQNRELPRMMFGMIADALSEQPELFPKRRGRVIWPRYGSGQEEIVLANGAAYRIAAASRGGARGHPNDLVIIDELREMDSFDVISAAEPTLTMSDDPQFVYLSNEGTERSVVLNSLRERAGQDDALAFLSWSAGPDRRTDDVAGWAESNPAMGHYPSVRRTLEAAHRKYTASGTLSIFETEHLCRRVISMAPALIDERTWSMRHGPTDPPRQPVMAVAVDPNGTRASAAMAWQQGDGRVAMRLLADIYGSPVEIDKLGPEWRKLALSFKCATVGFDPWTDAELAKHLPGAKPVNARDYANASATFRSAVQSGQLVWNDADAVSADLPWTAQKDHENGAWQAVRASEDRPITAVLAAIRAVWLASGPRAASPRVL